MEKEDNWIGKTIGCYKVLEKTNERDVSGHLKYRMKCVFCGTECIARPLGMKKVTHCSHYDEFGFPTLCGKETGANKLSVIFRNMKRRCYDTNAKDYRFYGEKGIKICPQWLYNPTEFILWAKQSGYEDGLSIDRIDSSKNYSPENCRWIPSVENSRYKSTTNLIMACGETHTGRQWAEILQMGVNRINRILRTKGIETTVAFIEENYKK